MYPGDFFKCLAEVIKAQVAWLHGYSLGYACADVEGLYVVEDVLGTTYEGCDEALCAEWDICLDAKKFL